MIPVGEYCRVKKDTTLFDAMHKLVEQGKKKALSHPHRDLLVEDEDGKIIGKVTMLDIFRSLEPSYFKLEEKQHPNALSTDFVQKSTLTSISGPNRFQAFAKEFRSNS